ncbi:MAG TPA: hypothetical protein PLW68_06245 [Casimicrobiaceae bacterium]|nr:hypothetical protein [Casimicrobiaceae bacterium]
MIRIHNLARGALGPALPDALAAYRDRIAARHGFQRALRGGRGEGAPR